MELPPISGADSTISIELGPNPQLSVMDYTTTMISLLEDFQIKNITKDKIWEVLQTTQPTTVKIGRLLSLDLEEELIGPFLELMLSDSRAEYGGCSSMEASTQKLSNMAFKG